MRTGSLLILLLAFCGPSFAEAPLGVKEFRLGMTAAEFTAAAAKYQWFNFNTRTIMDEKKPAFLVNGMAAKTMWAGTTEPYFGDEPFDRQKHNTRMATDKVPLTTKQSSFQVDNIVVKFKGDAAKPLLGALMAKYPETTCDKTSEEQRASGVTFVCNYYGQTGSIQLSDGKDFQDGTTEIELNINMAGHPTPANVF